MQPLIDCDILVYECSFAGEYKDEETGEKVPKDFSEVIEIFDQRVSEICDEVWATEEPLLFLTGDERLLKLVNKRRSREGRVCLPWKPNFRFEKAVSRPYKDRKSNKPYHFHNLRAYILQSYEVSIAWGMEADDMLSVFQTSKSASRDTIICSRDKDLRMVPGFHFGWGCGNQPAFGPGMVTELGDIRMPKPNKLVGEGMKFFYAQMIMGDSVDTIPGLPKGGPALAYKTLVNCESEEELYEATSKLYREKIGTDWFTYFQEQAALLWMVREVTPDGEPVLYVPPVLEEVSEVHE